MTSIPRPKDVGIVGLDIYVPKRYVSQADLEEFDGASSGKYTIGLAQNEMAVCDDREDVISLSLTVLDSLICKYKIDPCEIGRLEVGTESLVDKSKSVKTSLMKFFEQHGNTDIEGVDSINACYGATNALFNTLNWVESESWDGRYGIVIAADIAVYERGPARPTGGAAAVALLIGKDAAIKFDPLTRASFMSDAYDFYKPIKLTEYPVVDGKFSNTCYLRALDESYNLHMRKVSQRRGIENPSVQLYDYLLFHAPYGKLIAKSTARLPFFDYLRGANDNSDFKSKFESFKDISRDEIYSNTILEKSLIQSNVSCYANKVEPCLRVSKNIGNSYSAAVYTVLVGLVEHLGKEKDPSSYIGTKGLMFSYGSGLAATTFSFEIVKNLNELATKVNVTNTLSQRNKISPQQYTEIMTMRETTVGINSYAPKSDVSKDTLFPGTYYLDNIDEQYRRSYKKFTPSS